MENKKAKKSIFDSISWQFIRISYLPMIFLTIVIVLVGSGLVNNSLKNEAADGMIDMSNTILESFESMYPGDYSVSEDNGGITLSKGEHLFNGDFEYIDKIKEITGCNITICYQNYAVITTLYDSNNVRLVGAADSDRIVAEVIKEDKSMFYPEVEFNKEMYLAYYTPIKEASGTVIGTFMIAKKADTITQLTWKAVLPMVGVALIAIILAAIFTYIYSVKFIGDIRKIQGYMKKVAEGTFEHSVDPTLENRTDEIGQMADSAVRTSLRLRKMVEEDQLTNLYNRRSADKKIKATIENYIDKGVRFNIALGDIDFFKKVNDTYGHEAGDQVLIAVSSTLKDFMKDKGYAIRWGGEEFLLIFDKGKNDFEESCRNMEQMLDRIRALRVESGENIISVNMTFGILECEKEDMEVNLASLEDERKGAKDSFLKKRMDYYISTADGRLYYGKEHGRNQLVSYPVDTKAK